MNPDNRPGGNARTAKDRQLADAQRTPPPAGDARNDGQKLKQNREHLRVDEDHKTPEMRKHHRGTFP